MSKMKDWSLNAGLLWLRVLTGAGMAYHGHGKVFGGWMDKFAESVGGLGFPAPMVFAWAAALSEFAGGILLAVGLFSRYAAVLIFVTMGVAAFMAHGSDPFEKKELALAYFAASGALALAGPGAWSLDSARRGGRR